MEDEEPGAAPTALKNGPYPKGLSNGIRDKAQKMNTGRHELEDTTHQDRLARELQHSSSPMPTTRVGIRSCKVGFESW